MAKKIDIKKLLKRVIIIGMIGLLIGLVIGNRLLKSYGYAGWGDFITNYANNDQLASDASPVEMQIDLSKSDYEFMENKRQEALDRGVQINVGDNYVPCLLTAGNESINAEIRLKGHMTDHLEGEKWSFRVKSDEKILGMYRFSLQHPGTRGYLYEWIYHQLLKQEDVINLNYDFIHLKLRDKDLGIYAMEEHFGQHILEHNNRPAGAILRWNPNLYWEWRIDELQWLYLDEEYSAFSSSFAEPYDKGTVRADSNLIATYLEGAGQLEAFRRGEKTTSEVFDVERMARFHAIIDLVGGYHSLDWSDVKFFYNAESKLIEPVGYESFSIRKSERIAGQRIPDNYENNGFNYHDRLFADPIFFAAYMENLERICDEEYMHAFLNSIEAECDKKRAILALEWPHRKFAYDGYFENIELIRHNIQLPKPFHAFLENSQDSLLNLSLSPVSDFPVEIISVDIDGKEEVPVKDFVLPAKARNTFAHYFPLTVVHHTKKVKNIVIKARIPGASTIFEVEVLELPAYKSEQKKTELSTETADLSQHPNIKFNVYDSAYYFDEMDVVINQSYTIEGATLRILPGQKIQFENGLIKMTNSQLECFGASQQPILLIANQKQMMFDLVDSRAELSNTEILGGNSGFYAVRSEVVYERCTIADFKGDFISAQDSEIGINHSNFGSVASIGNFERSTLIMDYVMVNKSKDVLQLSGCLASIKECNFNESERVIVATYSSSVRLAQCNFTGSKLIASISESSSLNFFGGSLGEADVAFQVDEKGVLGTASTYKLYKTNSENVQQLEQ